MKTTKKTKHSSKRKPPEKRRLTKRTIEIIPVPTGPARTVVFDNGLRGFCIVLTPAGSRTFYLYRKIAGRPQRVRIGSYPETTPEEARRLVASLAGAIAEGRDPNAERRTKRLPDRKDPTFGEVLDHAVENHWKPHCRTWKAMANLFVCYSKAWTNRRLSTVRKIDVMELHGKVGRTNGTYGANRWRSLLHRMFEIAAEDFDFPGANPVRRVKPFPEIERERFVTPEELPRLFDAIDSAEDVRIADFLRLALLTGARKGSILRMKFADVDLARAVWTIPCPDSKNGRTIHVPLVTDAVEIIRARKVAASKREFVFPGRHGEGHLSDPTKPIAAVFVAAGLKDIRLHDLRRTYASWQAAGGSSELLIGKSLGHSSSNTAATRIYARMTLEPVRQSVERATSAMQAVVKADRLLRKDEANGKQKKRKGHG